MITSTLKLRLNKKKENTLDGWLWNLTAVYNWGLRKIELNAQNKIYFSAFDFVNLLAEHGKKMGIPSHTIQGVLSQVYTAWRTVPAGKIHWKNSIKAFVETWV